MKAERKHFDVFIIVILGLVIFYIGYIAAPIPETPVTIVNTTELEQQASLNLTLDRALGALIDELHEEKEAHAVCRETVDRWASDARTRQETKNEARRLRERTKKKGARK
jgi:uncharacterized Zn finger protein (UPF0148 family)